MSDVDVGVVLEARYRRLLARYPDEWRERNEDAVLGVLLDVAEAGGRSRPTVREVVDLSVRGLAARAATARVVDVRRRVAGIGAGLGLGFAVVYFAYFIGPVDGGLYVPATHAGPAAILLTWLGVAVAVLRAADVRWRLAAIGIAAVLPPTLWATRSLIDFGAVLVLQGWARPSNATAAFIAALALLAALGPIDRRLMLRTTGVAVVCFGIAFWISGGWHDPYDQSLWGAPDRAAFATPGTLQAIWGGGSGYLALATDHGPSIGETALGVLQATVLRLNDVAVAAVLGALVASIVLLRCRRTGPGLSLLVLTCPFGAALVACAVQPGGVWFQ